MNYTLISFDDNVFRKVRLTLNDMVCIERYIKKNPLEIFSKMPNIGDLAYIIFIGLLHYENITLDDIYDIIDDNELDVNYLSNLVITIFEDMGYLEKPNKNSNKEKETVSSNSSVQYVPKSFKEAMEELCENFTQVGLSSTFWDSNMEEINSLFENYKKKLRDRSESDYMLAMMISTNVGLMLNGKGKKIPSVEEYFPGLYTKEEVERRKAEARTNDAVRNLAKYTERFNQYQQAKEQGLVK